MRVASCVLGLWLLAAAVGLAGCGGGGGDAEPAAGIWDSSLWDAATWGP